MPDDPALAFTGDVAGAGKVESMMIPTQQMLQAGQGAHTNATPTLSVPCSPLLAARRDFQSSPGPNCPVTPARLAAAADVADLIARAGRMQSTLLHARFKHEDRKQLEAGVAVAIKVVESSPDPSLVNDGHSRQRLLDGDIQAAFDAFRPQIGGIRWLRPGSPRWNAPRGQCLTARRCRA